MSMMLNIGGSPDDPFYRYKMPALVVRIQGKGRHTKTIVTNLKSVCKSLNCDPNHPMKFIGSELGIRCKFDIENEVGVVYGEHSAKSLQQLLGKFIDMFVLCSLCKLPEVSLKVAKEEIVKRCAACGNREKLKNSYQFAPGSKEIASTKGKSKASGIAKDPLGMEEFKAVAVDSVEEDVVWFTDTSKEAFEKRKAEDYVAFGKAIDCAEAIMEAGSGEDDENKAISPTDCLRDFCGGSRLHHDIVAEIQRLALANRLSKEETMMLMLDSLLPWTSGTPKTIVSSLNNYASVFKSIANDNIKAFALLITLEELIGERFPGMLSYVPVVLENLYENDILEEEVLVDWYDNSESQSKVKSKAAVFIDWLKNAEEEADE